MQEGPKLLIEWDSRGRSFLASIRPAFSRSHRRLLVEVNRDRRALRPVLLSYFLHLAIVIAVIAAPVSDSLRTPDFVQPIEFHPEHYDIVYVPSNAMPQMTDAGGAASGSSGAAGGAALHTREQVIRIARGNPITPDVVDVPKLALPHTETPANLLVSSAPAPSVPANAIQHERIMAVQAFAVTAPTAPVPQVVREQIAATPLLPLPVAPPPVTNRVKEDVAGSHLELPAPPPPDPSSTTLTKVNPGVPPPDINASKPGSSAVSSKDTSVVMSSEPGPSVGKPDMQSPGAMAMSPTGAGKPGVGEGIGSGAGHGAATGSAPSGNGTGNGTVGVAVGDGVARTGISPGRGPGGSGNGMVASAIPGVTISGGQVMIPSFGPTAATKVASNRMPKDARNVRPVTIVSTAAAGGAVSARGLLKGPKVYTIYIDTTAGLAFLQFAEHSAGNVQHDLTVPEPLVSSVPATLRSARILLAGVMDRNGSLRNLRVIEAASQGPATLLIEALQRWHFRPAFRDDGPVEVDAIFGLNVDTK